MSEFNQWLKQCDDVCVRRIGVGVYDMPDLMWYELYASDLTPDEAIDDAIDQWVDNGDLPEELM